MAHSNLLKKKKVAAIPNKSIISRKFPPHSTIYKKPVVFKINIILAFILLTAIILAMISYMVVISKENSIKKFHFTTNKINYENIELQNKVDYLKSFYIINTKVQKIPFLKKADKVLEVKAKNKMPLFSPTRKKENITSVPGF